MLSSYKTNDINLDDWSGWLQLDVDPTKVLVIPNAVGRGERWSGIALRSLVIDRVRLAHLLTDVPAGQIQGLETFITDELASATNGLSELF